MKRTCSNCKALTLSGSGKEVCDLGYKVKRIQISTALYKVKPLENCPKPTTYQEFIKLTLKS